MNFNFTKKKLVDIITLTLSGSAQHLVTLSYYVGEKEILHISQSDSFQ